MNRELKEHLEREKYRGGVHLALALILFAVSLAALCWAAYWMGVHL